MKTLILMVGLPGSGKSTARNNLFPNAIVLSTDDIVEKISMDTGKTYREVFHDTIDDATRKFEEDLNSLSKNAPDGCLLVIDQTNLTPKARKKKLDRFGPDWKKIAVFVGVAPSATLKVNEDRKKFGRDIPDSILQNMIKSVTVPTPSEGFDYVFYVSGQSHVLYGNNILED